MTAKIKGVFEKKNVIVFGGAGFIGSHICEELLKKGDAQVICIDNFVSGQEINIDPLLQFPDFKFIRHDVVELIDLTKFPELAAFNLEFQGIQEIYNCASPTSYKEPKKLPLQTALTNSVGLKNILDLAKKYEAPVVHLSSSVVYGDPLPETKFFDEGLVNKEFLKDYVKIDLNNVSEATGIDKLTDNLSQLLQPSNLLYAGSLPKDVIEGEQNYHYKISFKDTHQTGFDELKEFDIWIKQKNREISKIKGKTMAKAFGSDKKYIDFSFDINFLGYDMSELKIASPSSFIELP